MVFEGGGNMSWDIWIIRTKTNTEEYKQINESNCIPMLTLSNKIIMMVIKKDFMEGCYL